MLTTDLIAKIHPMLFHMAEEGAWPSIKKHGLLSTSASLDLLNVHGARRQQLEFDHRPEKVTVSAGDLQVTLRDQKPMFPDRLEKALTGSTTPSEWYQWLNRKVFFWADERRLLGLLNARSYRNIEHDVITLDTLSLLRDHRGSTMLCHMNSGNTFPVPQPRDTTIFRQIEQYSVGPRGLPSKRIVEVVVDYSVPNIRDYVVRVERMRGSNVLHKIE